MSKLAATGRGRRVTSALAAAVLLALLGSNAGAWDTQVANGGMELGWEAAYIGNPQALSLPASGWTGNEHSELTSAVLNQLGAGMLLGLLPNGMASTTVVDLNSALYNPKVLLEEAFGDDPSTLLEERLVPPPAHFAGLPDYSYTMYDWIDKNTRCPHGPSAPFAPPPDPTVLEPDLCHLFGGWMGALNANHFGTQARNMYERYHLLALDLAARAKAFRELLAMPGHPAADKMAYSSFVKEAEIEALSYEAIGQHFLEDRWATGHMWERWNRSDYEDSTQFFTRSFAIAMAAGLMHGSEGITKLPDPMGSPVVVSGGMGNQAAPVRWRLPGEEPRLGVGDYRLEDMHDGLFGGNFGVGELPFSVPEQKERMFSCAKAGWHAVISALGAVSAGHYGELDIPLTGGPFFPVLADQRCWEPWATNSAMKAGWLEHPSVADIKQEARTFSQIATTTAVGALRTRLTPQLETTWRVVTEAAVKGPDSTSLAKGGIGSFLGSKTGQAYGVPSYTEPQSLETLPEVDPIIHGRDKHTLYGFFNRSHAKWWCDNFESVMFNLRGSPVFREQAACTYIANRVYKGTDPTYDGKRSEEHWHEGNEVDPICEYYGVQAAGVSEDVPYYLHPGYVVSKQSEGDYGYDSLENWCGAVAVVDRMMCPGPAPPKDDDKWDVVARAFENGGAFTLHGQNFGDDTGTVEVNSGGGVHLPIASWSDTQIEVTLPASLLSAGDYFLEVCPADTTRCSVGRFILRVGEDGPLFLRSSFQSDVEGWTHTGAASFSFGAGGGNPGGYLHIDNSEGDLTFIFAPASFEGNLSTLDGGSLSFDGNMLGIGGFDYNNPIEDYGNVRISGGGTSARADLVPGNHTGNGVGNPPKNQWTTFSIGLSAGAFGVSPATWTQILANVTEVRLSVEALFGEEVQGVDNFTMAAAPGDLCTQVP